MSEIDIDLEDAEIIELWRAVGELSERLPGEWVLIGGLRQKKIQSSLAKDGSERPAYAGKIRADHYAQALRDPNVRATLAKTATKTKPTRSV